MDQAELDRVIAAAGIDAPAYFREVTGSTNAWALEWADDGAQEWSLFVVDHQTAGRGRMGRQWVDNPGTALLFSVVLRPKLPPDRLGLLPLLAGWAMAEAATQLSGADVRCRWPNDLMIGDRKVGGILAESRVAEGAVSFVVLGIGLNFEVPRELPEAGSLGTVGRGELLMTFLRLFKGVYGRAGDTFAAEVLEGWRTRSNSLGREVEVTLIDGSRVRGQAADVADDGSLLVATPGGLVPLSAGDVRHVAPG